MKHIRLFEQDDWDEFGEESENSTYYCISTGLENECYVVKVEKTILISKKPSYARKSITQNGDNAEDLFDVTFIGGVRSSYQVYDKKVSFEDVTKKFLDYSRGMSNPFERIIVRGGRFLVSEKYMNEQEIKDLSQKIYNNGIFYTIKGLKERIEKNQKSIKKMEGGKGINYDFNIKTTKLKHNINFG